MSTPGVLDLIEGTDPGYNPDAGRLLLWPNSADNNWYARNHAGVDVLVTGIMTLTAADASVVVGGTTAAATVRTGTLDAIATAEPPAAAWSNNSKKITNLANGSAAQDAAAFGQIPTAYVSSLTADDASIVINTSTGAVNLETGTLDQIATAQPPGADWSNNSHKITNLATGTNPNDAVNLAQMQASQAGLSVKPSVQAATTGSETYTIAAGSVTQISGTTVDGVSVAVNDRVLVKDAPAASGVGSVNSTQPGNGIYVVTGNVTNLTLSRATDMSGTNNPAGAFTFDEAGTVNTVTGQSGWTVVSPNSPDVAFTYGTTAMSWTQFSGLGEVNATLPLLKTGNVLSINAATPSAPGSLSAADKTTINALAAPDGSTLEVGAGVLREKDGGTTNAKLATMAAGSVKANLTGSTASPTDATTSGTGTTIPRQTACILFPKQINGMAFIDSGNPQGWSGADVGAWINDAFLYLHTTFGDNNGGGISVGAGSFSYSTPVVLANAGLMSFTLEGRGDGNGVTILNYTPATATIAMAVGGGSGNDGGVQLKNFTMTGTAQGNGATAIQFGVAGVANVAGCTCQNISIRRFTNGFTHLNGNSYAVTFLNCKVQQTTNGYAPQGENNNWHGGLIGNNTNGLVASSACEYQLFGVAFDDNTTTAISCTNSFARGTLDGCRFENAGLGTDTYITMTNGSITQHGGGMQSDLTSGTSTGFVQQSGGVYNCLGTWLEAPAGRTFTQVFNLSGTATAHIDPIISPSGGGITATTQLCTAGFFVKRLDWVRLSNTNTALQSVTTVANTAFYITNSNLNMPAPLVVGIAIGTRFVWRIAMTKNAAGSVTNSLILYMGTNATTADTAVVTQSIGVPTAAVDDMVVDIVITWLAVGASTGQYYWSISPMNKAVTATGFGCATGTLFNGTTAANLNTTTAGLKFGIGFVNSTGTPIITVPMVHAQAYNLD